MNETTLARELIDSRCGNHSLGSVYEFLLRVCHDSHEAEAEFVKFISGELPQRLLEEARLWVAAEHVGDQFKRGRDNRVQPCGSIEATNFETKSAMTWIVSITVGVVPA